MELNMHMQVDLGHCMLYTKGGQAVACGSV